MLHTFFKIALLGALTASLSLADDFLARATNGALSDNSVGVKKLTADEASKVVGGYVTYYKVVDGYQLAVIAFTTIDATDVGVVFKGREGTEIKYDANGNYDPSKSSLCGADVTSCYMFNDTKTPYWQNQRRLQDYMQAVGDPVLYSLAYTVKMNVAYSRTGRFVYFSYGVAAYDNLKGNLYNITTSALLNNNSIVKELAKNYKEEMEFMLKFNQKLPFTKWIQ